MGSVDFWNGERLKVWLAHPKIVSSPKLVTGEWRLGHHWQTTNTEWFHRRITACTGCFLNWYDDCVRHRVVNRPFYVKDHYAMTEPELSTDAVGVANTSDTQRSSSPPNTSVPFVRGASDVAPSPRSHPLYLISAACMLLGCFVVQSAVVASQPLDVFNLGLAVMAYEALLGGAALALLCWPAGRNRSHLLALALLFFVDPTFTYFRIQVTNPWIGLSITAAVLVAAVAKMGWLVYMLRRRSVLLDDTPTAPAMKLSLPIGIAIAAAAAYLMCLLIAFLPVSFNLRMQGWVTPGLYLMWWLAAAVLGLVLPNVFLPEELQAQLPSRVSRRIQRYWQRYVFMLPAVFVASRLGFLHWLFPQPFQACFLTPVFLVLALHASVFVHPDQNFKIAGLRLIGIVAAIACSGVNNYTEVVALGWIAPWRITLWLAAMIYAGSALRQFHWLKVGFAAGLALTGLIGATPAEASAWCRGLLTWSFTHALPQSRLGWGLLTIGAAFLLLIWGFLWNLLAGYRRQTMSRSE